MTARGRRLTRGFLAATVPPVVAFLAEATLLSWLERFTWLLFYPAVFVSAWIGGRTAGIVATMISTVIAGWYLVEPAGLAIAPSYIPSTIVFIVMGLGFAWLHDRNMRTIARLHRVAGERRTFLALVESSSDFIGIADPAGTPIYLNPAGRRMIGLGADVPMQQTRIQDIWPKEVRPFVNDVIVKTMRERGQWSGEMVFRNRQTGATIPISAEHFIVRDETGKVNLGTGTVARDISEARRASAQLRDSEERFRHTIDEAPIGMALVALDGTFTRVNRALTEIVGYSAEELTKRTIRDLTHPDDLEANLAQAAKLARGEIQRYELEKRYIRKDGTEVDVMITSSMLRDREDRPVQYIAQVEDITERKRAEAALKHSEQRLALALEAARMGMWDLDLATGTSVRSLRHDQIFGYDAPVESWNMSSFMAHVVPEDRDAVKHAISLAPEGFTMECRIRRVDQTVRWISVRGRAFPSGGAERMRLLGTILDITDRKHTDEAVKTSEREFRSLAESMPQIVWTTTANGLVVYLNQQWTDYTGLTAEQSLGEGWIVPFHPDDRERAWALWQHALETREPLSYESRMRRADGVYQWWLIRGTPIFDEGGEILKWFGTCTDIEHIKVAEQKLTESEAKFSGIISISSDAIISIDRAQRITIFNRGAEQIFGYAPAEVIGTPLERLIPERFRENHRRHVEMFAAGDETSRAPKLPIMGLRRDGEEFPAEAAISKLQIGDATLLTVALRDITKRKRWEKEQQFLTEAGTALSASLDYEETLAAVARLVVRDYADWCVVEIEKGEPGKQRKVVSGDPSKVELCAALEQMEIDRTRPYLLRSVVDTKQPLLIEQITPEFLETQTQGPGHAEAFLTVRPTSLMALPLLSHGELLGVLAFISSGTRRYTHRDFRVAEALAERAALAIENARLYRASVDAAQLRDQVLGFVAHDLRNPLGAIMMQTSFFKRPDGLPERRSRKPGETIQRAATRMNRLIQDVLDVSKAGQLVIDPRRVSTYQIVADSVEAQAALAGSSSIEIQLDVEPSIADAWADRDRILQVFENLIGNALKFTSSRGRITVGASRHDGEIVLWVKDTGAGIAADELPHVFDRFWQARKTRRAGAGLGLQIVKGIVDAHGGRLWVESELGVGTTFYFTLPTAQSRGAEPTRAELH